MKTNKQIFYAILIAFVVLYISFLLQYKFIIIIVVFIIAMLFEYIFYLDERTKKEEKAKEEERRKYYISSEYNKIQKEYSDGFSIWAKENPNHSKGAALVHKNEIIKLDKIQKEYNLLTKLEKAQNSFFNLCKSKSSVLPHTSKCYLTFKLPRIDSKGQKDFCNYPVCQFFFYSYCSDLNLDYTYFKSAKNNFNHLDEYRKGLFKNPKYIYNEIFNFIKSVGKPLQIIVYRNKQGEDQHLTEIVQYLAQLLTDNELDISYNKLLSTSFSQYIILLDDIDEGQISFSRCEETISKYKDQIPCIVYISLMKEYPSKEMKHLIDRKNKAILEKEIKEKERRNIKTCCEAISQALSFANIELAYGKLSELENLVISHATDINLDTIVLQQRERIQKAYLEGLSDNFGIQHVDYIIPDQKQEIHHWTYPMVKFPKRGSIVFPYRRKAFARRGYSEKDFQEYLKASLNQSEFLIIGDCNILIEENKWPFEPDIAIISIKQPSIRMDIEIDEPYSGFERRPIHFLGGGDDYRDAQLNNAGWIVVRFTEYQVVSNPTGCIAFVVQVLSDINLSMNIEIDLPSIPEPVKRWTMIESKVMSYEKVREIYLKHQFGSNSSEEAKSLDIKQTEREKACYKQIQPINYSTIKGQNVVIPLSNRNKRDNDIQFFPYEHIYVFKGTKRLIAVSDIISYFFKPFNSDYWSATKAQERNVSQGQILEEWDEKGCLSKEAGTFMHKQIENYYNGAPYVKTFHFKYNGKYIKTEKEISLEFEHRQFTYFLKDHCFQPYRIEWTIYDEDLGIAGTIDMLHKRGECFDIYDWKRSHHLFDESGALIIKNKYGVKGIRGLEGIYDTYYWRYCIQQNLYKYILKNKYGIVVDKIYLIVFTDSGFTYNKIEVPCMEETLKVIIEACKDGSISEYFDLKFAKS